MRTGTAAQHARAADYFARYVAHARELGLAEVQADMLSDDGTVEVGGRRLVNFGSCGYMGLNTHPRLIEGAKHALDRFSTSFSSSPRYMAPTLYSELTELLDQVTGSHVLLAPTTTLAHLGALPVLIGAEDLVVMDKQSHASIHLACEVLTARGVPVETVAHNDAGALEKVLTDRADGYARVWHLADGLYSMHGDLAPFDRLEDLLARFETLHLYVDDAHAFSWAGRFGRGFVLERFGNHPRVVVAGSLSKSFGAGGAFLAFSDPDLPGYVSSRGSTFTFSGPIQPAALGAGVASAEILLSDEFVSRQATLMEHIDRTATLVADAGLETVKPARTPIWFIKIGEALDSAQVAVRLLKRGFFMNASVYPVVPMGQSGIRFTNSVLLSLTQLEEFVGAMAESVTEVRDAIDVEIDLTTGEESDASDKRVATGGEA